MPYRLRIALVILAAGIVYLIGNHSVPLWDRDEPRNAQAARQMYQSGDWVVPRFLDKLRTAKPPFTYWCQVLAMHALGDTPFAARLPSAIFMTATLTLLAVVLRRYADEERAFWTVLVLASSAIVIAWSARTSLTDSVLLLWITIAQLCLFAMLQGNASWPIVIAMAVAIGCAILTKGPVVLGVQATTLVGLVAFAFFWRFPWHGYSTRVEHRTHRLTSRATVKVIASTIIVVAIAGPWAYLVEHRAPGFLGISVANDVIRRSLEPLEQHFGPPGYYLIVLWGIFMPWSVLLPLVFVLAWRNRHDIRVRFALAAIVGPWLMFECVRTKLPHYLLPVFPPLAYLTADAIVRCLAGEANDLLTTGMIVAIGIWSAIVAALAMLPTFALMRIKGLPIEASYAITAIGVGWPLAVFASFLQRKPRAGLLLMGAGMILAMTLIFGWYLPEAQFLKLSVNLGAALRANHAGPADTRAGDVQMIAYKEPSLAFYQGGTIREQPENDFLLTHTPSHWPRFLVIRQDIWSRVPDAIKSQWEILDVCRGLDLADKGRTWTVYVLRKKEE